ncbi:hypothetical protein [Chryseobacterium daeguense]|uniref:hypothetical protein n=1 Tax=Chryseobacterium daeguense TaxID=412438 RepID=UPI0006841671|nr:hypothetical protein [Chryseobacterium daeguense]
MNIYDLSRKFWDFAFENPDKIKPNHGAMYFFAVEHCNRLGWKEKFGFPTVMAMEAIGIKSYNTFINTLKDLVEYGFIEMIEKSKNQYSANIIALSNFDEAHNKALDKALMKHGTKQSESTEQSTDESIDSINKQIYNNTNLQIYNNEAVASEIFSEENQEEIISEESVEVNPDENEQKEKSSAKKEKDKYFSKKDFKKKLLDLGATEQHIEDWFTVRDKKRAPYTETALNGLTNECEKNNFPISEAVRICAESSWQGFKYKWLDENQKQYGQSNNQNANDRFSSNGNGSGKINGRSNPFTVDDFLQSS